MLKLVLYSTKGTDEWVSFSGTNQRSEDYFGNPFPETSTTKAASTPADQFGSFESASEGFGSFNGADASFSSFQAAPEPFAASSPFPTEDSFGAMAQPTAPDNFGSFSSFGQDDFGSFSSASAFGDGMLYLFSPFNRISFIFPEFSSPFDSVAPTSSVSLPDTLKSLLQQERFEEASVCQNHIKVHALKNLFCDINFLQNGTQPSSEELSKWATTNSSRSLATIKQRLVSQNTPDKVL